MNSFRSSGSFKKLEMLETANESADLKSQQGNHPQNKFVKMVPRYMREGTNVTAPAERAVNSDLSDNNEY